MAPANVILWFSVHNVTEAKRMRSWELTYQYNYDPRPPTGNHGLATDLLLLLLFFFIRQLFSLPHALMSFIAIPSCPRETVSVRVYPKWYKKCRYRAAEMKGTG